MNRLETVILPARASKIENLAFMGCSMLNSVVLPPYLKKIGMGAFANCINLKSIDFPATLTSIGGYDQQRSYGESGTASFVNTGIEKFDFSKCSFSYNTGIDKSWTYVFADCNNLKEVRLPKGISNIEVRFYPNTAVACFVPSSVKRLKIHNVKEIHFTSPEPPEILEGISGCTIYVPKGCMTKYYAKFNGNANTIKEE
jgi:hypothetical protein